jgi:hypothetical protein
MKNADFRELNRIDFYSQAYSKNMEVGYEICGNRTQ